MASLIDLLGSSCPTIEVVDVGAMWLGAEFVTYRNLLRNDIARVVGFEPIASECQRLNALGLKNHTYLPYFIGDGTERTFYLTNESMTSSLYPPNTRLLSKFHQLAEITTTVKTERVRTRRLDDIPEITGIDFLKVDVQGGDLDVLRGAERHLRETLVVQIEAEFLPMYEGQPLFADIDAYLRSQGFLIHTMENPKGRAFKPILRDDNPGLHLRQVLWTDAVYVRDFMKLDLLTPRQLLKMAVIVNDLYWSHDLASLVLYAHDQKSREQLWPVFMGALVGRVPANRPVL